MEQRVHKQGIRKSSAQNSRKKTQRSQLYYNNSYIYLSTPVKIIRAYLGMAPGLLSVLDPAPSDLLGNMKNLHIASDCNFSTGWSIDGVDLEGPCYRLELLIPFSFNNFKET
jgi:hypothetical protein